MNFNITKNTFIIKKILPMNNPIIPIETMIIGLNLVFNTNILMTHVLNFDRNVAPRPFEREGGWIVKMVNGVDVIGDWFELFFTGFEFGECS